MPPTVNMADLPQNGMENARAWDGGKMNRIGLGWPKNGHLCVRTGFSISLKVLIRAFQKCTFY